MAHKQTYKQIAAIEKQIKDTVAERDDWAQQLTGVENEIQAGGPNVATFQAMKDEILTEVANHDKKLAGLREQLASLEETLPAKPKETPPKFDIGKHPILGKTLEKPEAVQPAVFRPGDLCEALWSDRQWYKAKVRTVLGSASDPKYLVRFVDYGDDTLTVGRDAIRAPPSEIKKRKAEAAPAPIESPTVTNPHVITGAASINPEALAAKKAANADPPPTKTHRVIGGNKALERKQASWQDFTQKKGLKKKESMFRSGTSVNSRVGITGSGAGMTETNKRVRYNHKENEDEDEPPKNKQDSTLFWKTAAPQFEPRPLRRYYSTEHGGEARLKEPESRGGRDGDNIKKEPSGQWSGFKRKREPSD